MFELQELSVILQGLDLVTITGASARKMVALQDKVEKTLQKERFQIRIIFRISLNKVPFKVLNLIVWTPKMIGIA